MGLLDGLASTLGSAVAAYEKARRIEVNRPAFLGDLAEDNRYMTDPFDLDDEMLQRRALQNSWFFSGVAMITGEVIASDFQVLRQAGPDSPPIQVKNHPFEKVLRRPNPYLNRSFLWAFTTMWLKLHGNAYWFLIPGSNDKKIAEIWPLPSEDVVPWPGDENRFVDYYIYTPRGFEYHIPAEYVVHFYNFPNPWNPFLGVSELLAAELATSVDTNMSLWGKRFFGKDNVMPSAIINFSTGNPKTRVDPQDIKELKDELNSSYGALKRKTLITSAQNMNVEMLGWSAREMDFVQGRKMSRKEIYEILGIPESINEASATEASGRIGDRRFKDTVWTRTLVPIAETITSSILVPYFGPNFVASFGDIRPGNRELELLEIDRSKGVLTVDEVRAKFWKLPPLPEKEIGESLFTGAAVSRGSEGGRNPLEADEVDLENQKPLTGTQNAAQPFREELKAWRAKSLKRLKEGNSADVEFYTSMIPQIMQDYIHASLQNSLSSDDVRRIFQAVTEWEVLV